MYVIVVIVTDIDDTVIHNVNKNNAIHFMCYNPYQNKTYQNKAHQNKIYQNKAYLHEQ